MIGVKEAGDCKEMKIDFDVANKDTKLKDLVDLLVDNDECVILHVRPGKMLQLMSLGCFDGDEEYIRLTKGEAVTCTIWNRNLAATSWTWGSHVIETVVTRQREKQGKMIQCCIEKDLGIMCQK